MSEPSPTANRTRPALAAAMGDPALLAGDAPVKAQVRVVVPLREDERARLHALLERLTGRPVDMEVHLDPEILGGVWVRMGDIVIDGSVRARLEAMDEQLCAQCNLLLRADEDAEGGAR